MQELYANYNTKRQDLFLQTKYTPIDGQDITKPLPYNPKAQISHQIQDSFQKSLDNLKTTYLDSYLLHSPLKTFDQTLEAWRTLITLQAEKKIRYIGISNIHDTSLLHTLSREKKVEVVQNRWYERNQWDRKVLKYCREHEILYQSFWTLTGSPTLLSHPSLLAIARASACTPAQIAYKLAQSKGVIPLSGTSNETHMKEDIAVQDVCLPESCKSDLKLLKELVQG